jgi:SAM-dependent methyltransferase
MPWSRTAPHPLLADWTAVTPLSSRRRAVAVGCALGADAEHLARLGFYTLAFDIAPTAIALARELLGPIWRSGGRRC